MQSLQTNPPAPAAGELFTLSATVRNVGGGTAEATTLRYYYWRSSTREWVVVGSDSVGGLAPSAASPQSMRLRYSRAGTYYLNACVASVAGEGNQSNCAGNLRVTVR